MNTRTVFAVGLAVGTLLALGAAVAGAQTAKDSAHVRAQKPLDDSTKVAMDALHRWCNATYKTPLYLRNVCNLVKQRPDLRARAAEDSLLIAPPPPPVPVNAAPHAAFTVSWAGTTATLDGSSSTDDKGITSYEWRTSDGRPPKTGPIITRNWGGIDQPYTEWLIVKDAAGLVDSTSRQILGPPTVPVPPPDTATTTPPPVTPPPVPPNPPSGTALTTILALVGPTKTVTETAALGAPFSTYDNVFNQYFPAHNAATNTNRFNNYYDRAKAYYARYARTGDAKFLALADSIVMWYRVGFLEPNSYGTQPHNAQIRGLEIHYRLTGDSLSRRAVAGLYAHSLDTFARDRLPAAHIANTQYASGDNRIQARVLQGALAAYRLQAAYRRPDGLTFLVSEWPTRLRDILNKILSTQNADGSYSWVQICGGQLNYMVGMLNDVLIEYWRDFEADPRIPTAVEKAADFLWSTQWRPADEAFNYASVHCSPNQFGTNVGGMTPAGDLNGLLISSFGWLRQHTGDPKWQTRGDAILAGLVSARWNTNYTGTKQFNQAFAEAYRYLGWR